MRRSTVDGYRSSGRKILWSLQQSDRISFHVEGSPYYGKPFNWAGFCLADVMEQLVLFSLNRNSLWSKFGPVNFEEGIMEGVQTNSKHLGNPVTIQTNGIYLIAFSTGYFTKSVLKLRLMLNNNVMYEVIENITKTLTDVDFVSAAVLIQAKAGDNVSINLLEGIMRSTPDMKDVSFMGLLYSPKGRQAVWSLARKTPLMYNDAQKMHLKYRRISYEHTILNIGVTYSNQSVITIHTPGYYYLHMSITCHSGKLVHGIFWT